MIFIYEEICANCDGTEDFFRIFHNLLDDVRDDIPHEVRTINTVHSGMRQYFQELSQDLLGIDSSILRLPVLIMGGQVYQGLHDIGENLYEAFITAANDLFVNQYVFNPRYQLTGADLFANFSANPDHVTLVYFYRVICPACEELIPVFENYLPQYVEINGRQVPVDVIRLNTRSGNNRDRLLAFLDAYNVPNHQRSVPMIFTSYGFYHGPDNIRELLMGNLGYEYFLGFRFPDAP